MSSLRWKVAQWLQLHWWKRYPGSKRPPEKYLKAKEEAWKTFLERIEATPVAGARILDAGCGPVGIFIALGKTAQVDAVDPLLIKYERKLAYFKTKYYPHVQFHPVPIERFLASEAATSPSRQYDWIFCLRALNRFSEIEAPLCAMSKALKPDGQLILSIDVHRFSLLKHLSRILPWNLLSPQQADLQEYLKLAEQCNLKRTKGFLNKKGLIFNYWVLVFSPA